MGFFEGTPATPGSATWLQNPQYSNVPNTVNSMWDYVGKGLQSIQAGQPPTWFQQFRPLEEYQRKNALTGQYYGSGAGAAGGNQFGPGILGQQRAADVKAGRRGAGAGSNYAKQLAQYGQGMQEIDNYLSKLATDSMQQGEQRYLQAGSSLPQGPQGQWAMSEGTPYQPSGFESLLGGAGSLAGTALGAYFGGPGGAAAGGQIGSGIGSLFGSRPAAATTPFSSGLLNGQTDYGNNFDVSRYAKFALPGWAGGDSVVNQLSNPAFK